jgi:hypothetical protein
MNLKAPALRVLGTYRSRSLQLMYGEPFNDEYGATTVVVPYFNDSGRIVHAECPANAFSVFEAERRVSLIEPTTPEQAVRLADAYLNGEQDAVLSATTALRLSAVIAGIGLVRRPWES